MAISIVALLRCRVVSVPVLFRSAQMLALAKI